ncbi:hypothetical protein BV898_11563 [Hypsibius exemplaris]|uniref:C2H2-type domain-containing protein n=1 Tax=Hypsibius exemplaris TaxID=2072580 RepID=A0A1W0WG75_HYPEX|nr:hypothetical protein BV898_11563 [Hypsibius exemplaris]
MAPIRGKPQIHDVDLEMLHLDSRGKDLVRCIYGNCGKVFKHRRSARRHVRQHLESTAGSFSVNETILGKPKYFGEDIVPTGESLRDPVLFVMHSTLLECEPNEVDESFIGESEDGLVKILEDEAHESLSMTVSHEQLSAASDDDEVTEEFAALPDWDVSRIDERCLAQQLPAVSANPSDLFNLCKLMHGCSDRAAIDFFELAKLGLNLSKMRQADISRATGLVSKITEYMRCRECTTLLEGNQCPQGWRGGIIGDCTDGSAHREFMKKALLTAGGCKVLTFTLNTDGVQLFENSDKSIWPFLLAANKLPKEIRFLVQNVLIYAIWEGKKGEKQDVPFDSVLEHLANDLEKINRTGN